ncbi:MAG: hypothetical protein WBA44_15780 [Mesorhizobium sp.]
MRTIRTLLTIAAIVSAAPVFAQTAPEAPPEAPAVNEAAGLPEWDKVYQVLSHPRCANCHTEDDHPRWSGPHYGATRVHAFNVRRGPDGMGNPGLKCSTCHMESNSKVLHGPPGAHNWHLAPVEMVWFGKSSAEICAQIKDPARTGGRDLAAIADHIQKDALVAWGWDPGPGRQPAPGSAEEAFEALKAWTAAGAPCPKEKPG